MQYFALSNTKRIFTTIAITSTLTFAIPSFADRPDHFKGLKSPTIEIALKNLNEYNDKLKKRIAGDISPEDMVAIHELTYTLENALETLGNEVATIAELLEEVHVASEKFDAETIKNSGASYIEKSQQLLK